MKKSCLSGIDNCLQSLLKKGVNEGIFSGAAVGVYKRRKNKGEKKIICCGKTKNESLGVPINENSLFDLASLTKPLCTVLAILNLIEKKNISLNTRIDALFGTKTPFFLKNVQVKHLLSHSSGMKAYKPFYVDFEAVQNRENKKRILSAIFKEKTVMAAGKKCVYSDLGFILLGEIVEKISGEKLNDFFVSTIARPLGLEKKIMFRPVDKYEKDNNKEIAATQYCTWRKRLLQGEVDDEHCWLMNGVAGHAGLFGNIHGVLDITSHILDHWVNEECNTSFLLSNTLLKKALTRQYHDQTWCLGFDTPSLKGSSGGDFISRKSVGHLGFTGTSFWIDPEKEMVIVLLTNRIYPTRNNEKIKKFRPLLHDTVFQIMQLK